MQIKEQSPELAKRSHVMKVSLDKVYDFALDPQAAKVAEGVIFRFMPDAQQVQHALSVGIHPSFSPCKRILGIPISLRNGRYPYRNGKEWEASMEGCGGTVLHYMLLKQQVQQVFLVGHLADL